ncbi:ceramide transfer protein [Culicoides brevitarsis]|uniref:ceramide transfer protein n=1 Tax=Culicoides brevitarsis TaxID=469753 RepID=UPI00307B3FDE
MVDEVNSQSTTPPDEAEVHELAGNMGSSDIVLKGYLSKWTNYIHGWQPRYMVLQDKTLSYYKSEEDSDFGCRGLISLQKATIKSHEFDECRFDVAVNNNVWYLRADCPEDKQNWIEVLQSYKTEAINSDNSNNLRRQKWGSSVSLQSQTLSTASGCEIDRTGRTLREKLHEIETFRDILYNQIDTLQRYFDAAAQIGAKPVNGSESQGTELGEGLKTIDFKGEAITFRATTAGVLTTLQHCVDIIVQKDENLKKKLDKEIERRKKAEEQVAACKEELEKSKKASLLGPDLEEGPHSQIPEDEFFDAVEIGLEKIEEARETRVRLKLQSQQSQIDSTNDIVVEGEEDFGTGKLARSHRLWPEIDRVCKEQMHYARQGVGEGGNGWQIFADEGELKMYRREVEVDGMVMDPLKSCHVVKGVTAREMCHYFFMPEFRNDWETTLEDMQILEKISPDALVFLQTHKRIWPASQRDALFWSHMRKIDDDFDKEAHDTWVVCNQSVEHPDYPPANQGKCVRIYLTVILLCQTYIAEPKNGKPLSRDDITCNLTYCSVVNPGGWAPSTVLRAIYKKEYPKFLKRFTSYVQEQSKNKPIMF